MVPLCMAWLTLTRGSSQTWIAVGRPPTLTIIRAHPVQFRLKRRSHYIYLGMGWLNRGKKALGVKYHSEVPQNFTFYEYPKMLKENVTNV